MDQATELEPARIEELLSAYRDLQAQFDVVRERLRRAEDNRNTVPRRIYDRVRADYDRELDSIRARLTPLRDELDRVHESLEAQYRDAGSALQAVEEQLAEVEFRHRIGEYQAGTYDEMRRELDARAGDARSRQITFEATLGAIVSMRSPEAVDVAEAAETDITPGVTPDNSPDTDLDTTPDTILGSAPGTAPETDLDTMADNILGSAPGTAFDAPLDDTSDMVVDEPPTLESVGEPAPAPASAPEGTSAGPRPVLNTNDIATSVQRDGFENPQQWISEMGTDAGHNDRRVRLSAPTAPAPVKPSPSDELDAVLAPLQAETTMQSSPASSASPASPSPTMVASSSLPSLVFVSGPYTGQAIALLPTTLTIGREHDNNVEIKDPEVARYHARILRERDDFVVEDLNSSTGTWVNGERKQRTVLSHGDVIRVGQTELALDFEWTTDSR
jgi:FHA domain